MSVCKHCGTENEGNNVYCFNCGGLLSNDNDIIFCLKSIGRGCLNPYVGVRNAINNSIAQLGITSGFLAIIIFVMSFLAVSSIISFSLFSVALGVFLRILLLTVLMIAVNVGVTFGMLKFYHRDESVMKIANLFVTLNTILMCLCAIPVILAFISGYLAVFVGVVILLSYYGVFYLILKDNFEVDKLKVCSIIGICYIATQLLSIIVGKF